MSSLLIAGNILKRALRSKKELIILTLLPIIIIALFSFLITSDPSEEHQGQDPLITVTYRVAGAEEGSDYDGFMTTLGFVITFIMVFAFIYMGNLMEDQRRLILARIYSYPVKEGEIILGNLLGSFALGIIQLIPILLALKMIFGLPFGQGFFGLCLILTAFLITSIGLGIGLSGLIKNRFNPVMLIATIIVPSSVLGGAFIPSSMMPRLMDQAGYIVPQKWVMAALTRLFTGAELSSIALHLFIILAFGLAFATFGIRTLKPLKD